MDLKKPGIKELNDVRNYRLVKTLKHDEVVYFVLEQIKLLKWPMLVFYGFLIFLLLLIAGFTFHNIATQYIGWGSYWLYMLFGIITGMLVVIPFHEALHGLAYRLAGAKRVKYGMDLKQMLFYASAPGFVAGRREFLVVAFFPFIFINLLFTTGIFIGQPCIKWASLVAVFVHSSLCIGDFAMINYMASFPGMELYTYDDKETNTSYFYIPC